MIRVLIADDHKLFVDALRTLLEDERDIEVVGIANTATKALELLNSLQVDIVLMDIRFKGEEMDGLSAAELINDDYPMVKVLILTASNQGSYIARMLRQKIAGYMLKDTAARELVKALHAIQKGETYYSVEVMKRHMDHVNAHSSKPKVKVTRREQEVLQLLVEEYSTSEIGEALSIGEAGVETHRRNLRQKFEVKNTAGLVREAILRDLVDTEKFKI
ncbi:MAG: response regulator transcription factor [Bacteroidota bacterium]